MAEHDAALATADAHLAAKADPRRPLAPLPAGFTETMHGLKLVAEHLLQPKRRLESGRGFLGFTPGGFGSLPWERGEASGEPGSVRVEGIELVSESAGAESRTSLEDLQGAAALLGIDPEDPALDATPSLDPDAAAALADWNAFGTVVLGELLAGGSVEDPEPIRLWPEHFDVATVVGSEAAGTRCNLGASPGDESHPEPYLYVGPWDATVSGELWNATGFTGAELTHAELLEAPDQLAAASEFIAVRLDSLAG